jgi:hypothetical protein
MAIEVKVGAPSVVRADAGWRVGLNLTVAEFAGISDDHWGQLRDECAGACDLPVRSRLGGSPPAGPGEAVGENLVVLLLAHFDSEAEARAVSSAMSSPALHADSGCEAEAGPRGVARAFESSRDHVASVLRQRLRAPVG